MPNKSRGIATRSFSPRTGYPDAVVFHESRGIYVVQGRDVEVMAKEFGIESKTPIPWVGFDEGQAWAYMSELAGRGYSVVKATKDGASRIQPPADRRAEVVRQRKRSTFVSLEPHLVFDQAGIENATKDKWLKGRAYQRLYEMFKRWLRAHDWRPLRDFGELYVYQVADDLYEVEDELTSMQPGHILLLAKAAFATGSRLPCQVVEPKCRRERNGNRRQPRRAPSSKKTLQLGQLGFQRISDAW